MLYGRGLASVTLVKISAHASFYGLFLRSNDEGVFGGGLLLAVSKSPLRRFTVQSDVAEVAEIVPRFMNDDVAVPTQTEFTLRFFIPARTVKRRQLT